MNEDLAAWVPAPILVGLVILMGSLVLAMSAWIWKNLSRRLDTIEEAIENLHKFATTEQLGSMGNRFDDRIGDLRERVKVLEATK